MEAGRNDPCPSGSGKKYKHCHIGQKVDFGEDGEVTERRFFQPVLLLLPGIIGPVLYLWKGLGAGIWGGVAAAMVAFGLMLGADLPSRRKRRHSGVGFGRKG